jgi:hypothetical protein
MATNASAPDPGVSVARLWVMRAFYLLMAAGVGATIWPLILTHQLSTSHMAGVAWALLGTIGILALLGLRYPLQMIPLLLFELIWKSIWLLAFALPLWLAGRLDAAHASSIVDTAIGLLLLLVIPWRYVFAHYVRRPGDPWRSAARADAAAQ